MVTMLENGVGFALMSLLWLFLDSNIMSFETTTASPKTVVWTAGEL